MTKEFPLTPTFAGFNAPSRVEAEIFDLEVEGEIPSSINGRWYRMTPDPQFPPRLGDDFSISGDGMISYFEFANGHADYKSKYVLTDRLKADRAARKSMFGAYRNPYTDDPAVEGVDRTTSNTTPVWHGGRLLTTKEDGRPYEIDPQTLDTRGHYTWGGKLRSETVTAHPKIDAETGEMIFFGYEAGGLASREIAFMIADKSGKLVKEEWFTAPYAALVHDFAVTKKYAIFGIFPTIVDAARVKAGGPHWMHDATKPTYVGVIPRDGTAKDVRWFEHRSCFSFHTINAYDDRDKIIVDLMVAEINPFDFIPDVSGAPFDQRKATPVPMRWSFNLSSKTKDFDEEVLGDFPGELPRIDDRLACLPYRYAYHGMIDVQRMMKARYMGPGFNLVGKLDTKTRKSQTWTPPEGCSFQEPQFVPTGAGEDDGYVVCAINHFVEMLTEVGVFDAKRFDKGPIARIRMPMRLRPGVHGTWVPKTENA
ncbi:MAG: carotenoid oxygenase family protein [Alphaproteobacteria bacterium]